MQRILAAGTYRNSSVGVEIDFDSKFVGPEMYLGKVLSGRHLEHEAESLLVE